MKRNPQTTIKIISLSILLMLVACTSRTESIPTPTSIPSTPTEAQTTLSTDELATLTSLEKVDDYPLYVMHYQGDFIYPQNSTNLNLGKAFACSLFTTLSQTSDRLYGRNFDWDFSPALLLFTDRSIRWICLSLDGRPDLPGHQCRRR